MEYVAQRICVKVNHLRLKVAKKQTESEKHFKKLIKRNEQDVGTFQHSRFR